MFDHVTIAASRLDASARFYRTVLEALRARPRVASPRRVSWEDWSIVASGDGHGVTRGLHVAFRAASRDAVDAFWRAGVGAGHPDDGPPGERGYAPGYYGAFLCDPDGNSVEAVHRPREAPAVPGVIDHVWMRVGDVPASRAFYAALAPCACLEVGSDEPGLFRVRRSGSSLTLIDDGRPVTRNVRLSFPAPDEAAVRAFQAAAGSLGAADPRMAGATPHRPGRAAARARDPDGHTVAVIARPR